MQNKLFVVCSHFSALKQPALKTSADTSHCPQMKGLTCDELILAKARIHKGVDKGGCKVLAGRVHCRPCRLPALHEMRLVHLHASQLQC